MAKVIKRNIDVALAIGIGLLLLVISIIGIQKMVVVDQADAQTTDTAAVTVYATVAQTIDISVSSSALNFGTLSDGSVSATNTNFLVKTNAANGYTVTIYDVGDGTTGGLATSSALIAAPSGSVGSTLTAGTQGYGAQCSTTDSDVNIYAVYNDWTGPNNVGPLATTTNNFTSSTSATAGDQSALYLRAAISATSTVGTYEDTITLTATGSF